MVGDIHHLDLVGGGGNINPVNGGKENEIDNIEAFHIKYTITDPFGAINVTTSNNKTRGKTFNPYSGMNTDGPITPAPTPPTPPPPPPAPTPPLLIHQ